MQQFNRNAASMAHDLSDPAQIAVNRSGELASEQRRALRFMLGRSVPFVLITVPMVLGILAIGGVVLASLVYWIGEAQAGRVPGISMMEVIWITPIGAFFFVFLRELLPTLLWLAQVLIDLYTGRVAQVEGRVVWTGSDYQVETSVGQLYLSHSGGFRRAATLAPGYYRCYYLPHSRWVVAVEPLSIEPIEEAIG